MKHRVSHVEAFRQFEADDEAEADELIRRILGQEPPSEKMEAGTAFHAALEHAQHGDVETLKANGYTFTFEGDFTIALPMIREVRASKSYMVDGRPFVVSGQVDAIEGKRVEDHKTTGRFDADRYIAGCQWRLYLDIFGADLFRWNVFEMGAVSPREFVITGAHRLEQWRYPSLSADCHDLVARYARFYRERVAPMVEAEAY